MKKRDRVAASLLKPINTSLILILGVYTIIWGLWIISPFWAVFSTATLYSVMSMLATEYVWGALAIIAGSVIIRGALKPSYFNIQMGSFVAAMHWLTIGILYILGDWMSTGGITSLTFFAYSAIIWVNIKINRQHYESKQF